MNLKGHPNPRTGSIVSRTNNLTLHFDIVLSSHIYSNIRALMLVVVIVVICCSKQLLFNELEGDSGT